jgi:hypothetical protein
MRRINRGYRLRLPAASGIFALIAASAFLSAGASRSLETATQSASGDAAHSATAMLAQLPLSFVQNRGQAADDISFYALQGDLGVAFTGDGMRVRVPSAGPGSTETALSAAFVGGRPGNAAASLERAPGVANFFPSNDQRTWYADVPTHARIQYTGVWPGIDVIYDGRSGQLESTYAVAAGGDPSSIRLRYSGQQDLAVTAGGDLEIRSAVGVLRESAPTLFQELDGRRASIAGRFELVDAETVGFAVGTYDHGRPLLIDPTITYSTFFGGSGSDQGNAVAVDSLGNAYITGFTTSPTLPGPVTPVACTPGPPTTCGSRDAFVTKLNPTGSAVLYTTYLGGTDFDEAKSIAVDSSFNAYITGSTFSIDFPLLTPFQLTNLGGQDMFLTKLGSSGALSYSTYLGGTSDDIGRGIAVSGTKVFVTGKTISNDYPLQPALSSALLGLSDAFVTVFDLSALPTTTLAYSRYLGGNGSEDGRSIAVDSAGSAYVTGSTTAAGTAVNDFPTLAGAFQFAPGGAEDAFVTKLSTTGTLTYSTYLGGTGIDGGYGIALKPGAVAPTEAYVTGLTASTNSFPTVSPFQAVNAGGDDMFVAKVNAAGSALVFSTYVGGSAGDAGSSIAVTPAGNAFVTGSTFSTNFPMMIPFQATHVSAPSLSADAFVTQVGLTGNTLIYSSYLGGSSTDRGWGIAADAAGKAYVTGSTLSSNFTTAAAVQPAYGGSADAFVALIAPGSPPPPSVGGIAEAPDLLALGSTHGGNGRLVELVFAACVLVVLLASAVVVRTHRRI